MKNKIKRIYEPPSEVDATRILVDRLWPRGLKKEKAGVDIWLKEIALSTELRKWFGHDPEKWKRFRGRYETELKQIRTWSKCLWRKRNRKRSPSYMRLGMKIITRHEY